MLYKELYKESNELAKERFVLVRERVAEIEENAGDRRKSIKNNFRRRHSCCRNRRLSNDLWADDADSKTEFKRSRNM